MEHRGKSVRIMIAAKINGTEDNKFRIFFRPVLFGFL